MTHFWIIFIPVVAAISLTGSAFIIRHVYRRRVARQKIEAANPPATSAPSKTKTKSKPAMRDILRTIAYFVGILLFSLIAQILRLPLPEIMFGAFFLALFLFILRHLFLWHKAKKLGCAEKVGQAPTAVLAAFIAFGVLFSGVGVVMLHFELKKQQRCSQSAQTVVVEQLRKNSTNPGNHGYSYYTIVAFQADGQPIRASSRIGWSYRRYRIGEELSIRYNPHDPHEILINGERNVLPAVFILFGLFFAIGIPILIFTQFDGKRLRQITATNKTAQI